MTTEKRRWWQDAPVRLVWAVKVKLPRGSWRQLASEVATWTAANTLAESYRAMGHVVSVEGSRR